jgi:hypothetical protein
MEAEAGAAAAEEEEEAAATAGANAERRPASQTPIPTYNKKQGDWGSIPRVGGSPCVELHASWSPQAQLYLTGG